MQDLFSERLAEWETCMAPWGWSRQNRWDRRNWMRMVFTVIKHNTTGKRARRRALRRIGAELIDRYRDVEIREAQVAQNAAHRDNKRKARWRVRRTLWQIYLDPVTHMLLATEERPHESPRVGSIERWVETSKAERGLQGKVQHAVQCLQQYTILVTRPREKVCREKEIRQQTVKAARQRLLRRAYSIYKKELQLQMLEDRAEQRRGLVCS